MLFFPGSVPSSGCCWAACWVISSVKFWGQKTPKPEGGVHSDLYFENGRYYESHSFIDDGGSLDLARSASDRARAVIHSYLDAIGGMNANTYSPTIRLPSLGSGR